MTPDDWNSARNVAVQPNVNVDNGSAQFTSNMADEHMLISRYSKLLARHESSQQVPMPHLTNTYDSSNPQHGLIKQLESRNREIVNEIQKLKREQQRTSKGKKNPALLSELTDLRQHRDQLEGRMSTLKTSRRDLVSQLDGIMQVIKNNGSPLRIKSPRSNFDLSVSPRSRDTSRSPSGGICISPRHMSAGGISPRHSSSVDPGHSSPRSFCSPPPYVRQLANNNFSSFSPESEVMGHSSEVIGHPSEVIGHSSDSMTCVDVSQAFSGAFSRATSRQQSTQIQPPQHTQHTPQPQRVFASRDQYQQHHLHQQQQLELHRSLDLSRYSCSPTTTSTTSNSSSSSSQPGCHSTPAISTSLMSLGLPAITDRDDLFSAADCVTDAMSQLVRQLHPEGDYNNYTNSEEQSLNIKDELSSREREMQDTLAKETRFIDELRMKHFEDDPKEKLV